MLSHACTVYQDTVIIVVVCIVFFEILLIRYRIYVTRHYLHRYFHVLHKLMIPIKLLLVGLQALLLYLHNRIAHTRPLIQHVHAMLLHPCAISAPMIYCHIMGGRTAHPNKIEVLEHIWPFVVEGLMILQYLLGSILMADALAASHLHFLAGVKA